MDLGEALLALRSLQPGESVVYYEGFLQDDRDATGGNRHPQHVDINMLGNEAYDGYLKGELELTQRRLGPPISKKTGEIDKYGIGPGFAYIATRRIVPGPDKRKEFKLERPSRAVRLISGTISQGDSTLYQDDKVSCQESEGSSGEHRVPARVADTSGG